MSDCLSLIIYMIISEYFSVYSWDTNILYAQLISLTYIHSYSWNSCFEIHIFRSSFESFFSMRRLLLICSSGWWVKRVWRLANKISKRSLLYFDFYHHPRKWKVNFSRTKNAKVRKVREILIIFPLKFESRFDLI